MNLGARCGLRISETIGLTVADLDEALVEEGVNPRVVMRLGGWEDFQSIKPYLDRPRDSTVAAEMETAGWV